MCGQGLVDGVETDGWINANGINLGLISDDGTNSDKVAACAEKAKEFAFFDVKDETN